MTDFKDFHVAYFSMEIGVDEDIPTYSGGLGVLAGDTLRSLADLEVPVIGVTLLYKKGYFKQVIDEQGNQTEHPVEWNPKEKLELLDEEITVQVERREVKVKAWKYLLKGVSGHENQIIFLDTDMSGNSEYDRSITKELYGKDEKYRLSQEIVLGVGGVRMLKALGCENIHKYHMNEGHSSLLTLELLDKHKDVGEVRDKCVFTTHTPVPAGHDQFTRELAEQILPELIWDGAKHDIFHEDKLNMTYLGLRFSKYINGVAKKHGEVSRSMFPGYHIESITNGVHSMYWTSPPMQRLFNKYIPGWKADPFNLRYILGVPKEELWKAHEEAKQELIDFVNQLPNVNLRKDLFTIGFARRAAAYKRGDMLFEDIDKLREIAAQFKGLQIIYAGKAHPKDTEGKELIKKIIDKMHELREHIEVCYLEDYDLEIAKKLVAGVDMWLNTPMRPKEASGTSGMKAAHNGVPHFSVLDGWWLEGHIENVTGWSIGKHPEIQKETKHPEDVEDLYNKLEYVILPMFYEQRDSWIDVMRHSIAINGSFFNTHRMVQQYVLNAYFE
mgnify:CR=1 FL=1